MKNNRFILVSLLISVIGMICSGCSSKSDINMNTDGSGTFSCKYSIEKKIFSENNFTKISSSKELVNELKKKVPKGTDLNFSLDTKSNKTEDIINVSFTYSSIAEFEKKINLLSSAMNNDTPNNNLDNFDLTEKDLEKYKDIYDTKKVISTSLATHLKKNNIKYDIASSNYKLLVSEIDSIINDESINSDDDDYDNSEDYDDEDYDDYDADDYDTDDYDDEPTYLAKIIKSNDKIKLRIGIDAISTLNGFIYSAITDYITLNIDTDTIMKETLTKVSELDVKVCTELFDKVKLADAIKKIDLTKVDTTTTPVTIAPTELPKATATVVPTNPVNTNTTVAPTEIAKATATVIPTEAAKTNVTIKPTETAKTTTSDKSTETPTETPTVTVTYDIDKLTEAQIKSIFTKELKANLVKSYLELTEKYLEDIFEESMSSSVNINTISSNVLNKFTYTINFAGTKQTYTTLELCENSDENGYITITIPNKLSSNQLDETPKTGDNSYGSHLLLASFLLMTSIIVFKKMKQN